MEGSVAQCCPCGWEHWECPAQGGESLLSPRMERAETHIGLGVDVSRSVLVISHERSPRTEHLVAPTDTVSAHFAALSIGIEGALRARYLHTAGVALVE